MKNRLLNFLINNNKILLWFILIIGISLRVGFILIWDLRTTTDSFCYIAQAESILHGNPFSSFPNGYPLIIASIIFLTGKSSLFFYLIFLNLIASILTGLLLYLISLEIGTVFFDNYFNKNGMTIGSKGYAKLFALVTLLLFSIYPTQVYLTNMILTETITTLFLMISVYSIIKNRFFMCGLSLAIAASIRTTFLPALILVVILLYFLEKRKVKGFLFGAGLVIIFINGLDFIGFTQPSNNQNYNFIIAINGTSSNMNHNTESFSLEQKKDPLATYIKFAINNPAKFTIQRISALYELWGPYSFEINNKLIRFVFGIRFFLFLSWLFLLVFIFKKNGINKNNLLTRYLLITSVFIANITIIHTIYFSSFRFIAPIEPLLIPIFLFAIIVYRKKKKE